MKTPAGLQSSRTGQGFTLIELVLAVVLLGLLIGATVFSYSSLQRGAALDEGVTQFEALIRYAQSQAASTGRKVQLIFEEDVADDVTVALGNVRVLWEPEPLTQPGQFVELHSASDLVRQALELVEVVAVRTFEPGELPGATDTRSSGGTNGVGGLQVDEVDPDAYQPPIIFYPDGSSDSAEITLEGRDPEDTRRVTIQLNGMLGLIRRKANKEDAEIPSEESQAPKEQKPVTTKTAPPVEPEPVPAMDVQ
jgi:prepilin-type N-terminal cleavage/methylation domain-containing protein